MIDAANYAFQAATGLRTNLEKLLCNGRDLNGQQPSYSGSSSRYITARAGELPHKSGW